jgi:hypothetical protein
MHPLPGVTEVGVAALNLTGAEAVDHGGEDKVP